MAASDDTLNRHDSLYFTDGNVVLLAPRPDESGILFRVHKSVLASHSSVFSDMFEVACNSSKKTSEAKFNYFYDGAPLIHLSDDATHLESILKIMYCQSTLPSMPREPQYYALITPILDLSIKYDIDRIRDQILDNLKSEWPQTLKEWDKLDNAHRFMANDPHLKSSDIYFPEPAAAVRLARQFNIPTILPAIFYHLSRLSVLDDWDETQANESVPFHSHTKCAVRWNLLTAKEFHCLLLGKAELARFLRKCPEMTDEFRHKPRSYGSSDCWLGVSRWNDICRRVLQPQVEDPLESLQSSVNDILNQTRGDSCNICEKALRGKIRELRAEIWGKLGDFFYLGGME